MQNNTNSLPPLDVGPSLARTRINLCVFSHHHLGKGSTHTNSLVGVTPRGENTDISQGKYIKDMIKKFGLQEAKPMSTPMGTNDQLGSDASGNMVDQKLYRSMIGSLLYVTTSRPDVMFSVCKCARYQVMRTSTPVIHPLRHNL